MACCLPTRRWKMRLIPAFRTSFAARWLRAGRELVYTGFFYEPHKADLEAYLQSSQAVVTGEVILHSGWR